MSLAVRSPWRALWLTLAVWMAAMLFWGCGLTVAPPDTRPGPPRVFCDDLARIHRLADYQCADALFPLDEWPDKTIVCVDNLRLCAKLGDLREWLERYQLRVTA